MSSEFINGGGKVMRRRRLGTLRIDSDHTMLVPQSDGKTNRHFHI